MSFIAWKAHSIRASNVAVAPWLEEGNAMFTVCGLTRLALRFSRAPGTTTTSSTTGAEFTGR